MVYVLTLLRGGFALPGHDHVGWFHVVYNFIGPSTTEGIRVYNDGEQVGGTITEDDSTHTEGDGRIVFGRFYTGVDQSYASVQMDELLFFNHTLSASEIFKLGLIAT